MFNMPILKFEKSTNYLKDQLDIQLNNKQLVSDIISNIGLFLDNVSEDEQENYLKLQKTANTFLLTISQNITTIEELNREIKHITSDLTEILSETNRNGKTKEYYIAAISTVKNNMENYTLKFQTLEKTLEQDNIDFNEFINANNFKYNFISNDNNDTYKFSNFSIDNQIIEKPVLEDSNEPQVIEESNTPAIDNTVSNIETEDALKHELKDESKDIIIDYSSIYRNYYKNASTIEENISSEYSNFPNVSKIASNLKKDENFKTSDENLETKEESLKPQIEDLKVEDENLEPQIEDLEVEDENLEPQIEDLEVEDKNLEPQIEDLEIEDENLEITDEDLLSEILNQELTEEIENEVSEKENIAKLEEKPIVEESKTEPQQKIDEPKKIKPTKIIHNNVSNYDLAEKIKIIKEASSNNDSLIISEKQNKIFLPYTIDELEKYLKSYPEFYSSTVDVVEQEFILPFNEFFSHPAKSRFLETYNLIRNRERKSIFTATLYALKLFGRYNLNPAIIASCKSEHQLNTYLYYLNSNNLSKFNCFKIIYEINPL